MRFSSHAPLILLMIILLVALRLTAQQSQQDSLKNALQQAKSNRDKAAILHELFNDSHETDAAQALQYALQLEDIGKSLRDKETTEWARGLPK